MKPKTLRRYDCKLLSDKEYSEEKKQPKDKWSKISRGSRKPGESQHYVHGVYSHTIKVNGEEYIEPSYKITRKEHPYDVAEHLEDILFFLFPFQTSEAEEEIKKIISHLKGGSYV